MSKPHTNTHTQLSQRKSTTSHMCMKTTTAFGLEKGMHTLCNCHSMLQLLTARKTHSMHCTPGPCTHGQRLSIHNHYAFGAPPAKWARPPHQVSWQGVDCSRYLVQSAAEHAALTRQHTALSKQPAAAAPLSGSQQEQYSSPQKITLSACRVKK